MSHFTTVETRVRDLDALKTCLEKLGFTNVEISKHGLLTVLDYYGKQHIDQHEAHCNSSKRDGDYSGHACNCKRPGKPVKCYVKASGAANALTCASSELGFTKNAKTGNYDMVLDHCDLAKPWVKKFKQAYAYAETMAMIKSRGYVVDKDSIDTKKQIHIQIHRSY